MACTRDDDADDLQDWEDPRPEDQDDDLEDEAEMVDCPYCGLPVEESADVCPHCGSFILPENVPSRTPWWILTAALLALAALLLWIF